jgi:small subunit ribosomal protein S9
MPEKKAPVKAKKAPVAKAAPKAEVASAPKVVEKVPVVQSKSKSDLLKVPAKNSYYGTGKRKSAIAKVWIFPGTGKVEINKKSAVEYVGSEILSNLVVKPLEKLSLVGQFDCRISCVGGGIVGQVGACQLGISRALLVLNPEYRKLLKEDGFLTRDPRVKERKKYGRKRARKGYQFRKR